MVIVVVEYMNPPVWGEWLEENWQRLHCSDVAPTPGWGI
jgi:hypothetical protein